MNVCMLVCVDVCAHHRVWPLWLTMTFVLRVHCQLVHLFARGIEEDEKPGYDS